MDAAAQLYSPRTNLPLPHRNGRSKSAATGRSLPFFSPLRAVVLSSSSGSIPAPFAVSGVEAADLASDGPVSVKLELIVGEERFDRIIAEAAQLDEEVVILWTASWCRRCIYLKPKLEKLAAEYYPRIRFYCIDVNSVPQRLVNRAGVTKMPTVQLWKDCKKQAEVIGGGKAYLVVNDVRQMIENLYN